MWPYWSFPLASCTYVAVLVIPPRLLYLCGRIGHYS
jgi:hypothetical protein